MAAAMAAELLVPLEQGPFGAGNGLDSDEWDAALFGCLDDRLGPAHLFPSLDPDPMFDCAFDGGGNSSPLDPPWDQEPPRLFPDLEVKSEPGSPNSSLCSDSSGPSCSSETPLWAPSPPELGVKAEPEPPPTLPCAPQDPAKPSRVIKAEGTPQNRRTPPPIQPKPPGGVPGAGGGGGAGVGGTPSPPQTILLQPLPGAAPPAAIAVPAPAVLLSPAELLLPGVLCLPTPTPHTAPRPGRGSSRPAPHPPGPSKHEAKTIVPAPTPSGPPGPPEVDARALRRQQRMIKNRESACQSRRRRKEYVQGLEQRLRQALADNEGLRRENGALRRRLDALLARSSELRPGPSPRKLACLAALLLLAFHLGPLSLSQPPPLAEPPQPPRARRHLLGVTGERGEGEVVPGPPPSSSPSPSPTTNAGTTHPPREPRPPRRTPFRNASLAPLPPWELEGPPRASDCRRFNRTESLRLADELSGWVRRHQIDRGKPAAPWRPPQFQASPSPWKAPGSSRFVPAVPPRPERTPPGQLQLFQLPEPRILAAIDRRDDTFYVVSFRRDHLLLPAISHNKTSRPKMSLVMPAAALNESLSGRGGGLEAMMQVDCEVMDTRVIHVRRRRSPSGRTPPGRAPLGRSPPGNRSAPRAPHFGGGA